MTPENRVNEDVAWAFMHYKFCVLPKPKDLGKLRVSPWSMPEDGVHVGIVWRINTGVAEYENRRVRFGVPGQPDWLGWIFGSGQMVAIEVKAGKNGLEPSQAAFRDLAVKTKILWGLVRSYAECEVLFKSWGLKRA